VPFPTATDRAGIALCALLVLSACATQRGSELPELDDWQVRQQVLSGIDNWGFTGRIAVSAGDDGFNGNLHWEQRREYFDARLSGPLGAGSVRINGDTDTIKVTDNDGTVTELADAERALQRVYGWDIPLASLRYWALGIPDPAIPSESFFTTQGDLSHLQQGGWRVSIDQYRESAGQNMPRRITAVRDATRVRLVVDRWTFH
jgi:outer membrane lipoprotein LolB